MCCSFIILFLLLCNSNGNNNCRGGGRVQGCGRDMGSGLGGNEDRRSDDCNCKNDVSPNIPIPQILPIVDNNCNDDRRCRDDVDFDRNRNRDFDRDRDRNRDRDCNCGMTLPPPWTRSNYSNGDTCGCEEK